MVCQRTHACFNCGRALVFQAEAVALRFGRLQRFINISSCTRAHCVHGCCNHAARAEPSFTTGKHPTLVLSNSCGEQATPRGNPARLLLFFLAGLADWAALQTMNQAFPSRPPLFLGLMLKLNPPGSE